MLIVQNAVKNVIQASSELTSVSIVSFGSHIKCQKNHWVSYIDPHGIGTN